MRRNRSNEGNLKRERFIMLVTSVLVLAALTLTGIYIQNGEKNKSDGYQLDLSSMENEAGKSAKNGSADIIEQNKNDIVIGGQRFADSRGQKKEADADLDYEVGSGDVLLPGIKKVESEKEDIQKAVQEKEGLKDSEALQEAPQFEEQPGEILDETENMEQTVIARKLQFIEGNGMIRPLEGEVLIPFSMDRSVYFTTLDQYKYNPALMLVAQEGMAVGVCAEGQVVSVFENAEIGKAVTLDMGDGYLLTYGQLQNIAVQPGDYIGTGELLAYVAAPTKYFSKEGANLYLKLEKDGIPIDPEMVFRN